MGYWPIKLSKTFIHHCLFPELAISNVQILDDFYAFIAVQDKEIFQSALVDFSSVDYEDVIEALNTHDCRTRIKESNLLAVLLEIAGKEIIQTPTFVSDCWRDILQELCIAKEKLDNIYAKLIPSNKGVLRMLLLPDFVNEHGNEVCKFLKRGVVRVDINLQDVDIDQCSSDGWFAGTHRCHLNSTEEHLVTAAQCNKSIFNTVRTLLHYVQLPYFFVVRSCENQDLTVSSFNVSSESKFLVLFTLKSSSSIASVFERCLLSPAGDAQGIPSTLIGTSFAIFPIPEDSEWDQDNSNQMGRMKSRISDTVTNPIEMLIKRMANGSAVASLLAAFEKRQVVNPEV
ncbi:UNVERIFIED_CONTAM: hypothetical protein FKN15_009410 [Acipenser sinensis]